MLRLHFIIFVGIQTAQSVTTHQQVRVCMYVTSAVNSLLPIVSNSNENGVQLLLLLLLLKIDLIHLDHDAKLIFLVQ